MRCDIGFCHSTKMNISSLGAQSTLLCVEDKEFKKIELKKYLVISENQNIYSVRPLQHLN